MIALRAYACLAGLLFATAAFSAMDDICKATTSDDRRLSTWALVLIASVAATGLALAALGGRAG